MKTPRTLPALLIAAAAFTAACRRDMQDQPKYKPLQKSDFFTDGRSARPIPAGTIAWDELNDNDPDAHRRIERRYFWTPFLCR